MREPIRPPASHGVDDQLPDPEGLRRVSGGGPTEDRSDAGLELVHGEGLDDVGVRARVERADHRRIVAAGRHDDDRSAAHSAEHGEEAVAVEVGKSQIEEDDVRLLLLNQPRHRFAYMFWHEDQIRNSNLMVRIDVSG